ncbi:MAG: sulfite exporter TauE/SafE family protein [Phormidesmis sp.]
MPSALLPSELDLWLTAAIGFLGSFGHCVGMCGPITAAFSLSYSAEAKAGWRSHLSFHILLNLGRLLSYILIGAAIGALGSVVLAGGQMAGVGSTLRRVTSIFMGVLLIWFGFTQAKPGFLPNLPFLHPAKQQQIHERISRAMMTVSGQRRAFTPLLLGLLWGLIPCGFLYTGQLRAVATQSWVGGGAVMMAFGAGTLPAMIGMGLATSALSQDRRSQLFRLGGWLTITIGVLLLLRTGDTMSDYSGHAALFCLMAALVARPISRLWPAPLRYRRVLGVGAFVLSGLHILHMFSHTWKWKWQAVQFMLPVHQVGVVLGAIAFFLMLPAALTSFDAAQKSLGARWRKLHLLSVPALALAAIHSILIGSHYWGALALSWQNQARVGGLGLATILLFGVRSPWLWALLSQKQNYALPKSNGPNHQQSHRQSSRHRPDNSDCCQPQPPDASATDQANSSGPPGRDC